MALPDPLPARLNVDQVCELVGGTNPISKASLARRVKDGRLPKPIDRGRTRLWDRDEVLKALGLADEPKADEKDPWMVDLALLDAALAPKPRKKKP